MQACASNCFRSTAVQCVTNNCLGQTSPRKALGEKEHALISEEDQLAPPQSQRWPFKPGSSSPPMSAIAAARLFSQEALILFRLLTALPYLQPSCPQIFVAQETTDHSTVDQLTVLWYNCVSVCCSCCKHIPSNCHVQAEERVLNYINGENRPFNVQLVADMLAQFGIKKPQVQRAVDALSEAGKITCKVRWCACSPRLFMQH